MRRFFFVLFAACSLLMSQGNEVITARRRAPGSVPIAYLASTSVANPSSDNLATTPAINTTGATLLIIATSEWAWAPCSHNAPTDSKSNSWTCAGGYVSPNGGQNTTIWYSIPTSVGSGHTFSDGGDWFSFAVAAFSATAASSVLDTKTGAGENSGSTLQPGTLTPSANNELLIAVGGGSANGVNISSVDSPFGSNLVQNVPFNGTTQNGAIALAYEIQTTATSRNPTWTFSTSSYEKAVMLAAFKPK